VVEAAVARDPLRLLRADAELEPERLRARSHWLACDPRRVPDSTPTTRERALGDELQSSRTPQLRSAWRSRWRPTGAVGAAAASAGRKGILGPMPDRLRVACVQLTSRADRDANLETAERLVARAAAAGADLVVLPEKWNGIGDAATLHALAEPLEGGESLEALAGWARRHGVAIVGGSITERREGREKLSNTCCVLDAEGALVAVYRKIHLFDVEVGGLVYRESEAEEPGDEPVVVEVEGWPVGLSVCYDLRFPELYRILALEGAELLTVPAHFTLVTGKDHWELLLRARAVENQCYVAAAAQVGETMPGRPSFGRSLVADPWGIVVAAAPDEETVVVAELDRGRVRSVREKLPSLANRRPGAYRWPAPA
jgi:predicted amidohydrolase